MDYSKMGRYVVLGILFFLPVTFLLFLYPATHHYTPLDIVGESVIDIEDFTSDAKEPILLSDHITVLGFFGKEPMSRSITALNLKELVYDNFMGFKKFQVVILMPEGTQEAVKLLRHEIGANQELSYWHFVYGKPEAIKKVFNHLVAKNILSDDLSTHHVYIIDKDLNQRGRLDDRTDREIEKEKPMYTLTEYDCIEVAEIKNKMSEDMRILFTEYRQKRKGEFNSETRRARDLKEHHEEN